MAKAIALAFEMAKAIALAKVIANPVKRLFIITPAHSTNRQSVSHSTRELDP